MADIWKAQVTISAVGIGGVLADGSTTNPNEASYLFGAIDDIGIGYAIEARIVVDPITLFYDSVYYACVSNFAGGALNSQANDWWGEPPHWFYILSPLGGGGSPQNLTAADNGAAWIAGGTLSITKDFGGNLITFTTPLGSMTIPLSTFTSTQPGPPSPDAGPFVAQWMGHGLATVSAPPGFGAFDTERWSNFYTYKNGVLQPAQSTALTMADPGTWVAGWDQFEFEYPPGLGFFGTHITNDFQDTGNYKTECLEPSNPLQGNGMTESRQFFGPTTPTPSILLDLITMKTGGRSVYARVEPSTPNAVDVGYSDSLGHVWNPQNVGQVVGRVYSSPSLSENPDGTLNLFVYDATPAVTRWFKSYDFAQSWVDNGFLLPLLPWSTISMPKAKTTATGLLLLSYNQAVSGNKHEFVELFDLATATGIKLTDFGMTMGNQDIYPGIWEGALGQQYLVSSPMGEEAEQASYDYGVDWGAAFPSRLTAKHQLAAVRDDNSAFIWEAYQDTSAKLFVARSDNDLTTVSTPVQVGGSSFVQQTVGIAVLPLGQILVIPQIFNSFTGLYQIQPWISYDFGITWAPA
jgi:hypothetical protein